MDVELYVYDLSKGMARQYSMALTGIQIDAIYHTAIVVNGVEYFFGQGIHRKVPGSTHHGRPINVVNMGQTQLPMEVILEYVDSLESVYSAESYDLFNHNCNNFSHDLAMFLVGKAIPEEIRSLPETFLRTPIGQMLRGQLDQSMRQMTQAPDAASGQNAPRVKIAGQPNGSIQKASVNGTTSIKQHVLRPVILNGEPPEFVPGRVVQVSDTRLLDQTLQSAKSSCACIFFTSATCPPCKMVEPVFEELAVESGNKAIFIKVDTSSAYDIASRYQIRGTPTFITYLKGKKEEEWSGADPARLRGSIRLLTYSAHPKHAHTQLRLPTFQSRIATPIMYTRTPPLEKLAAKIGPSANEHAIQALLTYIKARNLEKLQDVQVPDLDALSAWIATAVSSLPQDRHFAIIDLIRVAACDPRISSYFVVNSKKTLAMLIPQSTDYSSLPYNLQAVTLQLACNLFSDSTFQTSLQENSTSFAQMIEHLAASCLLAEHHNARSLAAALVYNLAAYDHNQRIDDAPDKVDLSSMADLEAALVDAVVNESQNKETLRAMLLALGLLLYGADHDSGIWELCRAMEVRQTLQDKSKVDVFKGEKDLIREVGEELLGKGGA